MSRISRRKGSSNHFLTALALVTTSPPPPLSRPPAPSSVSCSTHARSVLSAVARCCTLVASKIDYTARSGPDVFLSGHGAACVSALPVCITSVIYERARGGGGNSSKCDRIKNEGPSCATVEDAPPLRRRVARRKSRELSSRVLVRQNAGLFIQPSEFVSLEECLESRASAWDGLRRSRYCNETFSVAAALFTSRIKPG